MEPYYDEHYQYKFTDIESIDFMLPNEHQVNITVIGQRLDMAAKTVENVKMLYAIRPNDQGEWVIYIIDWLTDWLAYEKSSSDSWQGIWTAIFLWKNQFLTLLAQLHINRSEEHREMPSHYAKDTLLLATDSKSNLHPLRDAENGIMFVVTF